jgi:hypothetical protein
MVRYKPPTRKNEDAGEMSFAVIPFTENVLGEPNEERFLGSKRASE